MNDFDILCSFETVKLVNGLIERMAALRTDPLPQLSRGLAAKFDRWAEFEDFRAEYRKYSTYSLWNVDPTDVLHKEMPTASDTVDPATGAPVEPQP